MLDRHALDELIAIDAEPAVSIYLPTHTAGREVRQDPTRLKNLLSEAERRLTASGGGRGGPSAILEPARRLVADDAFRRHRQAGLAVFLAADFSRVHGLPVEVRDEVVIGPQFHIKPLLPAVENERRFWLLTISASRTRLYRGDGEAMREWSAAALPQGVGTVRQESEYEEAHAASPGGRRGGLTKAQPLGDAPDELKKAQLIELLRRIAAAAAAPVRQNPAPVVLAATPEIQGQFRRVARLSELLADGIVENPDAVPTPVLARCAAGLVDHRAEAVREAALGQLKSALGNGDGRAATHPEAILKAASNGRVDRLFLCGDQHVWGRFDAGAGRVLVHGSPVEGDVDLLDCAAVMTLRHGGALSLVDPARLPRRSIAAALLRY
jgi:hypothetical protein